LPGFDEKGTAQREESVREGWSSLFKVSSSPLSPFDQFVACTLHHPLLESKVQTQLLPSSETQIIKCFHPLMDIPLYGGCTSALLTSAVL